jgi:hypothetical protein
MQKFVKALNKYKQNNDTALLAVATAVTPATVTVPMLIATTDLPAGFSDTNSYGATLQGQFLQPQAGVLRGIAMAVGGNDPGELDAGVMAAKLGAKGGRMTAAGTAIGAYNGWNLSMAGYTNPGTNRLIAYLDMDTGAGSAADGDNIHRHAVAGHPELTSMYTPINMRAQATENTSDALCIVGDATTYGRIAVDSVGAVLSCQTGIWKKQGSSFWKDPVNTYASLPLTDQVGTVRMTLDTDRAFMWNGATWGPLAVDQNGNLTMTGTMTAGKTQLNDVVTENTACASNGLMARDASGLILSCQSGVWHRSSIKPGGGQSQLWQAMAGQTIYCTSIEYAPSGTAYTVWYGGYVDANGQPYSRIAIYGVSDTGWQYGTYIQNTSVAAWSYPNMTLGLGGVVAMIYSYNYPSVPSRDQHITCLAYWS